MKKLITLALLSALALVAPATAAAAAEQPTSRSHGPAPVYGLI